MRLSALVSLAVALVSASGAVHASVLNSRQPNPDGVIVNLNNQLPLPHPHDTKIGSRAISLDTNNIQGLAMVGMRFMMIDFVFFNIVDPKTFKAKLKGDFFPHVTTAAQLANPATQPAVAANIAFSQKGMTLLGVNDNLGDPNFKTGQAADAIRLGDPGTTKWHKEYQKGVMGVLSIASKDMDKMKAELESIQKIFGSSLQVAYTLHAHARPGAGMGHEHFGWVDGITQPAVEGWDTAATITPGQFVAKPGVILLGEEGDNVPRPAWAKSGSFLCWRQLEQLVPEFHKYLNETAPDVKGLSRDDAVHLFGSRMNGRWKSGAPIDLAPFREDEALGADPLRRNNFNYDHPELKGFNMKTNQTMCPFSAHILRSRPRGHIKPEHPTSHMMRGGLPYGPEGTSFRVYTVYGIEKLITEIAVTDKEQAAKKTFSDQDPTLERGMAFAAYQSNLENGFIFIQDSLVNNPDFPAGTKTGVDPIVGSTNKGTVGDSLRVVKGMDWNDHNKAINIQKDFVVTRGGEYFFSPPVSAIKGRLAQ
ncbi:dye-decolorizing heme-containing peroxidase [Marasmius tenuissimus]|uniref:Dye-decolorizing heme-containing peroxidase n=1 Tax=Marasmius tenuissimus TaxID=585030 RepID=A0ABR3A881_9AGAR